MSKRFESKLLLDEYPLVIIPSLAVKIGLNEAIILQQFHYWIQKSEKEHEGKRWLYNTYDEIKQQIPFLSISTIRRTITNLEKMGLVIKGNFNKLKIDNTNWYTIDYQKLEDMNRPSVQNEQTVCSNWTDDLVNLNTPLPETSSKTSSKINNISAEADTLFQRMVSKAKELNIYNLKDFMNWNTIQIFQDERKSVSFFKKPTNNLISSESHRLFVAAVVFGEKVWESKREYKTFQTIMVTTYKYFEYFFSKDEIYKLDDLMKDTNINKQQILFALEKLKNDGISFDFDALLSYIEEERKLKEYETLGRYKKTLQESGKELKSEWNTKKNQIMNTRLLEDFEEF